MDTQHCSILDVHLQCLINPSNILLCTLGLTRAVQELWTFYCEHFAPLLVEPCHQTIDMPFSFCSSLHNNTGAHSDWPGFLLSRVKAVVRWGEEFKGFHRMKSKDKKEAMPLRMANKADLIPCIWVCMLCQCIFHYGYLLVISHLHTIATQLHTSFSAYSPTHSCWSFH